MPEYDETPECRIMDAGPGIGLERPADVEIEVVDYDWEIDEEENERHGEKFEETAGTET